MKLVIDTEVLSKENISFGEYLVLLMGYHNIDYEECCQSLAKRKLVQLSIFGKNMIVLPQETKELVANIAADSNLEINDSNIDFNVLAKELQSLYPEGNKPNTPYLWRGRTWEIVQKLKTLVLKYKFKFTAEEAVNATKEYVNAFNNPKYMSLLKCFLLKTMQDNQGHVEIESMFMSIIENNRNENNN